MGLLTAAADRVYGAYRGSGGLTRCRFAVSAEAELRIEEWGGSEMPAFVWRIEIVIPIRLRPTVIALCPQCILVCPYSETVPWKKLSRDVDITTACSIDM